MAYAASFTTNVLATSTGGSSYTVDVNSNNYSVAPFPVTSVRDHEEVFTGAQNHIIEFPAGLIFDPPSFGTFTAPAANTLTIRRVALSGVSINGVVSDGFTWVVPATGRVIWRTVAANTILLWGDSTASQLLAGPLDAGDQVVSRPELKDVAETVNNLGTGPNGAALTIDYTAGGYQYVTTGAGNITAVTITNPPASGRLGALTLEITQGAAARTIAWGAAYRFPGGTDFTLTASAGAIDIFTMMTRDAGATWYVFEAGKAFAA